MSPTLRAALSTGALGLVVAALAFLLSSGFADAWHGRVVSARPAEGSSVRRVLIAAPSGSVERDWPADVVERLALPVDRSGVPPDTIAPERPATKKLRWSLSFTVDGVDGPIGTTRPGNVVVAVVGGLLAALLRNMAVAGAPWRLVPGPPVPLAPLPPSGTPHDPGPRSRSRPGPPPSRPRVGRGRR